MRHGTLALLVGLVLAVVITTPAGAAPSCPWMNAKLSAKQRAHELVSAMTIDQKIAMLSQAQPLYAHYGAAGYVPAQPSLCIPDLVLNDAGQGVGDAETNTTAFPAPIAQSSSWDPSLQRRFGAALGWQAWHKGINVQLAPGIEIDRVPLNGRNFEYMSEDPYLAGQGAVAEVRGIQSNPVIATVKHYVANSQETNRMTVSSDVDQRTLEEIYTAPYEAAVKQGHAGSVMCSYNRINGTYACENRDTLTTILKRQFGFTGFVMSDWGATHSTVAAANAGLDMEMDVKPGQYFTAPLKTAVEDGQVRMSRLDDMVTRIARTMFAIGIFDHPAAAEPAAAAANVQRPQDIALARSLSEEGTVLLKNQGQVLPLTGNGKRIAVIGPGAGPTGAEQFYNGAGSGHIPEFGVKPDVVTPLQGITQRALAGGDVVTYADGSSSRRREPRRKDRGRGDRVRRIRGQRGHRPLHPRPVVGQLQHRRLYATARGPGQPDLAGRRRQPAHDRRAEHRRPGADAVAATRSRDCSRRGTRDNRTATRSRRCCSAMSIRRRSCPRRSRRRSATSPPVRRSSIRA